MLGWVPELLDAPWPPWIDVKFPKTNHINICKTKLKIIKIERLCVYRS